MKILVTGSAGFIGWKVSEVLLAEGHTVAGIDNLNDAYDVRLKDWRLAQLQGKPGFDFHRLDISDRDALRAVFRQSSTVNRQTPGDGEASRRTGGIVSQPSSIPASQPGQSHAPFDAVINLAARAGVRQSVENPWVYYETNVTGCLNVLDLCREFGVKKFILASTSSLYGGTSQSSDVLPSSLPSSKPPSRNKRGALKKLGNRAGLVKPKERNKPDRPNRPKGPDRPEGPDRLTRPFREDDPTDHPLSPYAASKKAAEALCYTYHYLHKIDVSVLRYFTVYGPAGRPDMSLFRFVQWISEGRPVTVFGDGKQSRDFTYVEDIARGALAALKPVGFEIINLGSDQPVALHKVIGVIEGLVKKKARIQYQPRHAADMMATWADISKAKKVLGWEPGTTLKDGLKKLVAWYNENRSWAKDIATG